MAAVIAAVVLAAGASSRFGGPKQLLRYRGVSLLRHAVDCALEGGCEPVLVVLGARADELRGELQGTSARAVVNRAWEQGLGSSVRAGVAAVEESWPGASGVLLMAVDQPLITAEVVRTLRERFSTGGARLIACRYAGTTGVPALFARSLFAELLALTGPGGAKAVLQAHADELLLHDWPDGAFDIDTPADLE